MRISRLQLFAALAILSVALPASALDRIAVRDDHQKLIRQPSGEVFTPFGFNYDRDYKMRLIEDYWIDEWDTVVGDFREMKALGANIVRIHLSVSQFLETPDKGNAKNLAQLTKLVQFCEDIGIYLDVTGLGCYRKEDVPEWFANPAEQDRWKIQATFWDVVSEACDGSPAVAWFDLINEPAVPGDPQKEWLLGHLERYWYCQFITLDPAGRDRGEIARAWVKQMSAAIRKHDQMALITVGMLPFSSAAGQPSIGFDPPALKDSLDLICVHNYPKTPPYKDALFVVERFDAGKPLVIEEIFPLDCKPKDLDGFFKAASARVDGWIGFYWGQTPEELERAFGKYDPLTLGWLKVFPELRAKYGSKDN